MTGETVFPCGWVGGESRMEGQYIVRVVGSAEVIGGERGLTLARYSAMLLRSYEFPSAAICGSVMSVYEMGHKNSSGALGPADDEAAVGCRIAAAFAKGSRATRQPAARDAASAALDCGWS